MELRVSSIHLLFPSHSSSYPHFLLSNRQPQTISFPSFSFFTSTLFLLFLLSSDPLALSHMPQQAFTWPAWGPFWQPWQHHVAGGCRRSRGSWHRAWAHLPPSHAPQGSQDSGMQGLRGEGRRDEAMVCVTLILCLYLTIYLKMMRKTAPTYLSIYLRMRKQHIYICPSFTLLFRKRQIVDSLGRKNIVMSGDESDKKNTQYSDPTQEPTQWPQHTPNP